MESKGVLTGKLKNTFLEFESEDEGSEDSKRRPSSDPTSRSSSCASWSESEESQSGRIYRFRGDLRKPVRPLKVDKGEGQQVMTEQPKPKRKCTRPCKGKRERFRKYVDKIKTQVDQDPEGFDYEKVDHPEGLLQNDKGRKKVESIIENYRAGIMAKGSEGQPTEGTNASASEHFARNPDVISL